MENQVNQDVRVVDKEITFRAGHWDPTFKIVQAEELPLDAVVVDIRSVGATVSLFVQERVPEPTEKVQKANREFYLYKLGEPYQKPPASEFKFLGIVGEVDSKYAVYEAIPV